MKTRPVSVTVIAWILLLINALSLLGSLMTINDPLAREQMAESPIPVTLQFVVTYLVLSISILCAIFMMRAANWARLLYIACGAIGLVFGLLASSEKLWLIPGILIYAIIVFFLLRPKAKAYFTDSASHRND